MNHYLGYRGYAIVYLLALVISLFVAGVISVLLSILKTPDLGQISSMLMLVAVLVAGYFTAERFFKVEGRPAIASEAAQVALEMARYVSIAFVSGYLIIVVIDWSYGEDASKLLTRKAILTFLVSWMGFMLVSYLSLLINFLVSSVINREKVQN